MTQPKAIMCGDGENATRIQYVHGRDALRLTSADGAGRELSLTVFCDELGIGRDALAPATYFLFAGTKGAPGGGCRDLVGTYASPNEARRDFVAWRRKAACSWAEVINVSNGRITALCWFGVNRVDRVLATPAVVLTTPERPRRWRRARAAQASSRA
jgi:hypothetical protein